MLADLRDALRQLRKAPGFTATAVITLALGIGATTAIFSLVHQVMLKSLPVTKPDELWRIGDKMPWRRSYAFTPASGRAEPTHRRGAMNGALNVWATRLPNFKFGPPSSGFSFVG
jgi:hypothetical protein